MNLIQYLDGHPEVEWTVLDDPLGEWAVAGIPPEWRQTAMESVTGNPGPVWVDLGGAVSASHDEADPPFASQATVVGWELHRWPTTLIELVTLAAGITEEVPGWTSRESELSQPDPGLVSLRMAGALESPYGPLVSNIQNVAVELDRGCVKLIQLAVTTTSDWTTAAEKISLVF